MGNLQVPETTLVLKATPITTLWDVAKVIHWSRHWFQLLQSRGEKNKFGSLLRNERYDLRSNWVWEESWKLWKSVHSKQSLGGLESVSPMNWRSSNQVHFVVKLSMWRKRTLVIYKLKMPFFSFKFDFFFFLHVPHGVVNPSKISPCLKICFPRIRLWDQYVEKVYWGVLSGAHITEWTKTWREIMACTLNGWPFKVVFSSEQHWVPIFNRK